MTYSGDTATNAPRATYRLQFSGAFTFADAETALTYLDTLGVSHVYASPLLQARAGSAHGYDIIDHNALNPEIGGREGFESFVKALRGRELGLVLDFVPNHMGIGRSDNRWWLDVLEWGRASPYAFYFDIDWEPAKPELRGKVLLPFLGDHYGAVLEAGELRVAFDRTQGSFSVWYHEHRFPIGPRHYGRLLGPCLAGLRAAEATVGAATAGAFEQLLDVFRALPGAGASSRRRAEARRRAAELKAELARLAERHDDVSQAIERMLDLFNGVAGDPRSFLPLHRLLEAQAYRLAFWRVAADEINYRRFFDINELAGLRIEEPELFDIVHRLIFDLADRGEIDGLRIDHIDGLYDPRQYCERLHQRLSGQGRSPFYVVVEKILAQHEYLPEDWPVDGTTGYEFASLVNGLFVDPNGERPLRRIYRRFTGAELDFNDCLYRAKQQVLEELLASELQVLANELDRIAETNWRSRDFTLNMLRDALREVVACFPVYRTYVTPRSISAQDRRDIDWAVSQAGRQKAISRPALEFIYAVLTTDLVRSRRSGYRRIQVVRFAMKFQQFTGPAMAKALEDTAFYRYHLLISLNDVGGDPRRFGVSVAAFHHANEERSRRWPNAMLATSTHDSKRGEDVRARINVLSELPEAWATRVRQWSRLNRRLRTEIDGQAAPSRNDEYLLYQTLVGSWPPSFTGVARPPSDALADYISRIDEYMIKAVREAKLRSSWSQPDGDYEAAVQAFVRGILDPKASQPFLSDFVNFQQEIVVPGVINSLAQTALKLTAPGVPDIYQGSELWNLSLVDPDNRRPVDYGRGSALLSALRDEFEEPSVSAGTRFQTLRDRWPDGRIKLYLIWRLLAARHAHPQLFAHGAYAPLEVVGAHAANLCAFARIDEEAVLVVAAPRCTMAIGRFNGAWPLGEAVWGDTAVVLPPQCESAACVNVLTGTGIDPVALASSIRIPVARLFTDLPVATVLCSHCP